MRPSFILLIAACTFAAVSSAEDSDKMSTVELAQHFQERVFTDAAGQPYPYRVLLPADFDKQPHKTYPLVLFLHGAGERGDDNRAQLKHGAAAFDAAQRKTRYPSIVIFPQCPKDQQWVMVPWSESKGTGTYPAEPSPALTRVIELVEQWLQGGRVDTSCVYVTGLSMGGYGTWHIAALRRSWFAAALPICGGGDPTWAERYQGLPIWNFHGVKDQVVPVARSREMQKALQQSQQQPVPRFTEYPEGAHDVWTETYLRDDVFEWLYSQRK